MEEKFREAFQVDFDAIDFTGKMSIQGLSRYMQIIAGHHASSLNFNFFKNGQNPGYYWIISKVKYVIESYPKWDDEIILETYPGGYDKLYAVRLFDVYDKKQKKIACIIGDYLLMDMEKKRPVRIKGGAGSLTILDFPYEGEKLQKLKVPDRMLKVEQRKAYYSEMDLNNHMNNAHYVKWAIDMLPFDLLKTHEVSCLEINYNASIEYGKEVKLVLSQNEAGTYVVSGQDLQEDKNYFIAEMTLRPR